MSSTVSLLNIVNQFRAWPELSPVLENVGGSTQEPALTIANNVMQKILALNLNWKFNRKYIPPFITVGLQQDYITNVTNMGWLEQAWRIDINNTTNPKPIRAMETARDLAQTSAQANPFYMSWIPNNLAIMGAWFPNTNYFAGYGQPSTPTSPIQQFIDQNGNILFINSNSLGLSLNSPGFSGTVINTNPPYGVSGATQPFAAPNAAPGTTVVDGTVTWTVGDPNGVAMRLAPLPALNGLCWFVVPSYQMKPPKVVDLKQFLDPIPDEYIYLFRSGFLAECYMHAGSPQGPSAYQKWEESIMTALRAGDRETEENTMYPSEGLMGGIGQYNGFSIGPAQPYDWYNF